MNLSLTTCRQICIPEILLFLFSISKPKGHCHLRVDTSLHVSLRKALKDIPVQNWVPSTHSTLSDFSHMGGVDQLAPCYQDVPITEKGGPSCWQHPHLTAGQSPGAQSGAPPTYGLLGGPHLAILVPQLAHCLPWDA